MSADTAPRAHVRRRHVFYVEGYDPQGAEGYYRLFRREWKRFLTQWPLEAKLGDLVIDSDEVAHWSVEAAGPNWKVATRYDFLRLEGALRAKLSQPMPRQILRAARWLLGDLVTGTTWRIVRASWRFELHLFWVQLLLGVWLALTAAAAWLVAVALVQLVGLPVWLALIAALAAGAAVFIALRPLAQRWFVIQLNNCWPHMRDFARGQPSGLDRPIEVFAQRIVAAARANEAEEIVVIGHSGGGAFSPVVMARALALDPQLGRRGPRVVLLTLGSIMPAVALHPRATRMRAAVERMAVEPDVQWIDCQARKDVMNFWDFDPVAGIGIDVGARWRNPLVWIVRMRDMVSPEFYARLRWDFFRMHYQFIMANDRRAPYDYFMLTCGPVAVEDWVRHGPEVLARFSADGSFATEPAGAPVAA